MVVPRKGCEPELPLPHRGSGRTRRCLGVSACGPALASRGGTGQDPARVLSETELKLRFWRGDQIGSERLAAALLHLDGFSSVDPQCHLGGPDGL